MPDQPYNPNHAEAASKAHERLCAVERAKDEKQELENEDVAIQEKTKD